MRYIIIVLAMFITMGFAQQGYCDWEEMMQVNTNNYDKQAPRDSDCPWPIATDDSGNVYTVWEDFHNGPLEVFYRKRNYDGTWDSQEKISNEETVLLPLYGHPSICVVPGQYPPKLLTCYVREYDGSLPRELRGNTFDGDDWGDPSYYISNDGGYELTHSSPGWGTNIVALSDGNAYAFWQYVVGDSKKLYFNEYDDGWTPSSEKAVYDDGGSGDHFSRHENACVDDDDNIHLVYSDDKSGQFEIYYLWKKPQDNDFGDYPGYHVSTSPRSQDSYFPYCAVSMVADTTFLHVVWSTIPTNLIYYRYWNSITETWSSITDTIAYDIIPAAEKPSIACDSYGNVHIVWEEEADVDIYDLVKYRKFDYATGEWGTITTLPADEEEIEKYGMPVIISDVYDNLHVLMTGSRVGSGSTDEEAYYSFFDAPPHIWDLTFLQSQSNQDSVVIDWEGMDEPDLNTYKVYRKFEEGQWQYVGSTTDTRYADTSVSYSVICGDSKITNYYVEAVDDASQSAYTDTIDIWCVQSGKMYAGGNMAELIDLQNNYPNPFNARTTIEYNVPYDMEIILEIYDILGRKVETLIDEFQSPGSYAVTWDASHVASGMYFYKLQAGDYSSTRRMSIIK